MSLGKEYLAEHVYERYNDNYNNNPTKTIRGGRMKTQILPYEKFLFIEDGSVDVDSLILELEEQDK